MPHQSRLLNPRVKVWLESDGSYVFGHGLATMLQAVDDEGSIKRAAQKIDKSYRYVWGRIREAEESLGFSLINARVGGKGVDRSELTPTGRRILAEFVAMRQRVCRLVETEFRRRFRGTF
jgi:molybdate transport system regulatory protein